jgi:hypothetical protein
MRKLIFAFLICFITQQVCSQGNFYIYIQSEDNAPFYVRSGSKTFQSSGNGYLIIPNLLNDTYDLIIGFPETAGQEWKFTCSIAEKDLGFILKNNHSKGVELNGLKQEKGLTGFKVDNKPEKKAAEVKQPVGIISEDPFSSMLADVVNDPTIKQQPTIILTARDSLNLAKAQKKDSVITSLALSNKLPEIKKEDKTILTADSGKAVVKTGIPVVPKVDSTLVASANVSNPVTGKKDNKAKKIDSAAVASVKQSDSALAEKTLASKENKTDSTTVAAILKPADKRVVGINKEKKADSIANKSATAVVTASPAATKAVAKNDSAKNISPLIPDSKKKADSTIVAVIKPALTDKTTVVSDKVEKTDSPANKAVTALTNPATIDGKDATKKDSSKNNNALANNKKKTDSAANKAITTLNNTTTADTKAMVKNDAVKSNATSATDAKKKADSVVATTTKPATVTPSVEIKKAVVVSSTAIKKTLQRKSADGIELIYIDEMSDGTKETIRILIPAEKN